MAPEERQLVMDSAEIVCQRLRTAKRPEDIFGAVGDPGALRHVFNDLVRVIHPDKNPGIKDAGEHVKRLIELRAEGERFLKEGTYGKPRKAVVKATLRSKAATYEVVEEFRTGEVADLFIAEAGGKRCVLKLVRAPGDNDLLDNEARVLAELHRQTGEEADAFRKYLPKLLDSFELIEGRTHRRANVLDVVAPLPEYVAILKARKGVDADPNYYSLAEIREAYPEGIDARDLAWMVRRMFTGLGWVHSLGWVHGAVLPEHVLVHATEHGARFVGWSYAVRTGARLTAVSSGRRDMYPPGVFRREPAKPALDIQLVGQCAKLLLSDEKGKLRKDVPAEVAAFFEKCRAGTVRDGRTALRAYDDVLTKLYGKRTYRAFAMPR